SESFLDTYLAAAGADALDSVGCYRIEGLGAQLFARIDGSQFAIMGLPLLPLLGFLREHQVLGE
ncbi:MAG TPA: Maf family protein, partial [Alphaproteobacteria bacterium]